MDNKDLRAFVKQNSFVKKKNTINYILNSEIKPTNLINQINAAGTPPNNTSDLNNNSTIDQNSTNNLNTINANSNNNNNFNNNVNDNNELRKSTTFINKNSSLKTYDIYSSKLTKNDTKTVSQYEFFWITSLKSFILTIETPLITIFAPSNDNYIRQYINFELLFYIYQNNFIMWDFYIMKYLSTFKNFRHFFEQLYSIPKKMNISFFLTTPKIKKILSTNYELSSIMTRPLSEKQRKNEEEKTDLPRILRKFESSKTKNYSLMNLNHLNNFNKNNNSNSNTSNKNRYSKQIENKLNSGLSNKEPNNLSEVKSPTDTNKISSNKNNNILTTYNSIFIQKGLLFIATYMNEDREIINEFTIHFNVDQLRKFQIMEIMQDKMSYFLKFMHVNYDTESISFDFESFKELNEMNWIPEVNKYNFNYLSQHQTISEEKFIDENGQDMRMIKVFKGKEKHVQIKVEMKCPLIIMQDLDDLGFKITERVNVDSDVEKILSKITIHNSLDLTKQLINILKDKNFCRKISTTNRVFKKKTTKKKINILKDNRLMSKKNTNILSVIADSKED